MNQADLRRMADGRIRDARVLIRGKRWEFAYYVAGYSVECALKSCVLAQMVHTAWVFEDKWDARKCLTHDFNELVVLAGLKNDLDARRAVGAAFDANWTRVLTWKSTSRYAPRSEAEARDLFAAITDKPDGVLRWLKNYW